MMLTIRTQSAAAAQGIFDAFHGHTVSWYEPYPSQRTHQLFVREWPHTLTEAQDLLAALQVKATVKEI